MINLFRRPYEYLRSLALKYLIPDHIYGGIRDVDVGMLMRAGISGLIIDIDNTLAAPGVKRPDEAALHFLYRARDMGCRICLLSNALRGRVARFSSGVGIYAVARAKKPARAGFIKALRLLGLDASQTCVIGDQLFTDILGAKRLGIKAVYTRPITRRESFFIMLKRIPELFLLRKFT